MLKPFPICQIIPPHILNNIVERGKKEQRARAMQSLTLSARIRGQRDIASLLPIHADAGTKRRTIYNTHRSETLPGTRVRGEGGKPVKNRAVNEAYDYCGDVYDFYKAVCERNSVDDQGLRLDSTVHYGEDYDNAFWNGSQMVYGDGDGQIFQRFTKCIDVIGHELTHGLTQFEAGLVYQNQPGALNEHFSDVFGSLLKQFTKKQTARKADWLIGEGLLAPDIKGIALRSLKDPGTAYNDRVLGKDPQPAHMKNFVKTTADSGGVHINSGIPNKAFYELAVALDGNAWEKAGNIWYRTLVDKIQPQSQFQDCAGFTFEVAGTLYGANGAEQKAIKQAWAKVGIAL